ncbi:hypothetical protein BRADI_3g06820v3 [Brachypodium distachyon]|uniref:PLATZ transcription factor family protein n=1 Tax=Brachypodium distachyon TaxID=15368 RepID=A0A0Q3HKD6_BRADI|nr:hypothetical protein BRADI_3g06820v3 [Brachypodium distachyon]
MATVKNSVEEAGQKRFGPAWLRSLVGATFYTPCPTHLGVPKNECNHYCVDCIDEEGTTTIFCSICFSGHTDHHHVLQIRRSSYHEVVRVVELETVVDISLVQTYVINGDKVVFLNARPMALGHGTKCVGPAGTCLECGRALIDATFQFCSLGCKINCVARVLYAYVCVRSTPGRELVF